MRRFHCAAAFDAADYCQNFRRVDLGQSARFQVGQNIAIQSTADRGRMAFGPCVRLLLEPLRCGCTKGADAAPLVALLLLLRCGIDASGDKTPCIVAQFAGASCVPAIPS